jgi:murein L,D-transpeptidase YcbB/YkuD
MRETLLPKTTQRSRLSARVRWSAVTALCLTFGAGATWAETSNSLPADTPAMVDSAPGQFMAAPIEIPISEMIRTLMAHSESLPASPSFVELSTLREFYAARNYEPLWVHAGGPFAEGDTLLTALREFDMHSPADLAPIIAAIESRRTSAQPAAMAEMDWALTLAVLRGGVNPADPLAAGPQPQALMAVATAKDPMVALAQWLPNDPGFWQLRQAVDSYQEIALAGGWPTGITGKDKEEFLLGARSDQIALLRQRLAATGDYVETAAPAVASTPVELAKINPLGVEPAAGTPDPRVMDQALIDGIKHFQARHGLFADGVVGKMTLDALNVPVESRLRTMMINLRRLQLADREFGADYVMINIAGQQMTLVRNGVTTMTSDVIVGAVDHRTPEVESAITRIEFNPVWYVPNSIQSKELLPKIQEDSSYIASQNFRVFDTATGQHVDPSSVNWNGEDAKGGRYKLRQSPGSGNALGSVKFLFPNPYDVYLHGTNKQSLFAKQMRALSHGCIRLPDAPGFAEAILMGDPDWNRERIDAILAKGDNKSIALDKPLPVHVVYQTAWADDQGLIHFRNDIYGRDKRVADEMKIALATP